MRRLDLLSQQLVVPVVLDDVLRELFGFLTGTQVEGMARGGVANACVDSAGRALFSRYFFFDS